MKLQILLVILFLPLIIAVSAHAGEWSQEEIEAEQAAERAREEAKKNYREKGLIYKIWVDFEDTGCDCDSYESLCKHFNIWAGYVVRNGCRLLSQIDYTTLTRLSGHEPFVSGPHGEGRFNLDSPRDFGHYNKDFVVWVSENMIPGAADDAFREFTRPVYHGILQNLTRGFYAAWVGLKLDNRFRATAVTKYKAYLDTGSKARDDAVHNLVSKFFWDHVRDDLRGLYRQGDDPYNIDINTFGHGVSFWLRRNIDKTEPAFAILFERLFEVYDKSFLEKSKEVLLKYSSDRHDNDLSEYILYRGLARDLDRDLAVELLDLLAAKDLRLLRNAIFATKGYSFENADLRAYFGKNIHKFCRSRHCGVVSDVFDESLLTETDRENIHLIKARERGL